MDNPNTFKGEITVASRIVDYLSSGLYESPSACLKELINNSYDADATEVNVFIKPDADRIIIEDNGDGMDHADFVKHFKKISESHKRDESDYTFLGRPKIGRIGIGFIAANEICDIMQIISTKKDSTELLEVTINFAVMREEPETRRKRKTEFSKADYFGKVSQIDEKSHFTQVFLKNIRGEAKAILAGAGSTSYTSGKISLYGISSKSIFNKLMKPNLKTWQEFDAYSKNILEIALNIPVKYHTQWLPSKLLKKVDDNIKRVDELNFDVFIDGSEVRKSIVFNPIDKEKTLISHFKFEGKHVSANGYFYAQHGSIRPQELQGMLIRIRNAAVGEYDSSFLGFTSSIGSLFQSWISGEINADDRLEEAMNIDRRTLRVSHPAYVELQSAVHEHIAKFIKKVRDEIYKTKSEQRNLTKAKDVEDKIVIVADKEIAKVAPLAAQKMKNVWKESNTGLEDRKKILRKFTVDEIYQIVIDVAKDVLNKDQLEKFVTELTERLRK